MKEDAMFWPWWLTAIDFLLLSDFSDDSSGCTHGTLAWINKCGIFVEIERYVKSSWLITLISFTISREIIFIGGVQIFGAKVHLVFRICRSVGSEWETLISLLANLDHMTQRHQNNLESNYNDIFIRFFLSPCVKFDWTQTFQHRLSFRSVWQQPKLWFLGWYRTERVYMCTTLKIIGSESAK